MSFDWSPRRGPRPLAPVNRLPGGHRAEGPAVQPTEPVRPFTRCSGRHCAEHTR